VRFFLTTGSAAASLSPHRLSRSQGSPLLRRNASLRQAWGQLHVSPRRAGPSTATRTQRHKQSLAFILENGAAVPIPDRCRRRTARRVECIKHSTIKRCAACTRHGCACAKYVDPKLAATEDPKNEIQAENDRPTEDNVEEITLLTQENTQLTQKNAQLMQKNTRLTEKNTRLTGKNTQLAEKNKHLRTEKDFWKLQPEKLGFPGNFRDDSD
jgi:hypothetical protein